MNDPGDEQEYADQCPSCGHAMRFVKAVSWKWVARCRPCRRMSVVMCEPIHQVVINATISI